MTRIEIQPAAATRSDNPNPIGDVELVVAAQGGDEAAFGEIVRRYHARVFRLAMRIVQDFDDAHDVAQETFIRAHEKLGSFRRGSSFFTWIYRIAHNNSINLLRKRRLRSFIRLDTGTDASPDPNSLNSGEVQAAGATPHTDAEAAEIRDRVDRALSRLPNRQRSVFVMRQFDGLSHREISDVVGCTEGSVRASYYHAVKKLQEALCDLR